MGGWAGSAEGEEVGGAAGGVGDVVLVVRGVEIDSVPASGLMSGLWLSRGKG